MKNLFLLIIIIFPISLFAQRATTQQILSGEGSQGTVTQVTSANTNILTVANGTTTPTLTPITGSVIDGGTGLSTQDQINDFVATQIANFITKAQITDSLNERLQDYLLKSNFGDSATIYTSSKVNYSDSITKYITPSQLSDSLDLLPGGHDAVTLSGSNYLSILGQQITANAIDTTSDNINQTMWAEYISDHSGSGSSRWTTTGSDIYFSNKVAIGNTTPDYYLDVYGNVSGYVSKIENVHGDGYGELIKGGFNQTEPILTLKDRADIKWFEFTGDGYFRQQTQTNDPANVASFGHWYFKNGVPYVYYNSVAGELLINKMTTRGDLIYRNASNVTARLPIGASGTVLGSDGTDVSWVAASGYWNRTSSYIYPINSGDDIRLITGEYIDFYNTRTGTRRASIGMSGDYLQLLGNGGSTAALQVNYTSDNYIKIFSGLKIGADDATDYLMPTTLGSTNGFLKINTTTGNATWELLTSTDVPTLNQNTTGSAGSLKSTATTGLMTVTGMGAGSTRVKTVRDANDTFLELNGSYAPTGTWHWDAATVTWPTFNQNTTGSSAKWTTARTLAGNSVDGSANVAFSNKFIVQGTSDSGLSGAQFLGSLGSGLLYNTTSTGVLSIASGSVTSIDNETLPANRALITDGSGKIAVSSGVTSSELEYLASVTSDVQTQLNAKDNYNHWQLKVNGVHNTEWVNSLDSLNFVGSGGTSIEYTDLTNTLTFTSSGGDLVNDLTPQLGGDLDLNTHNIYQTYNTNEYLAFLYDPSVGNGFAFGAGDGSSISGATYNIAAGGGSLLNLTSGDYNSTLGHATLYYLTTGSNNVAVGHSALQNITTGSGNIGIGSSAGLLINAGTSLQSTTNCTYIGYSTRGHDNSTSNETVIGYGAYGNGSNTITLGNSSVTKLYANQNGSATLIAGKFQLSSLNTAPSSSSDTGTTGEIRITSDYIFVCVATNTWKRIALSTW